jgi:hypothetical protein
LSECNKFQLLPGRLRGVAACIYRKIFVNVPQI